MQLGDLLRIIMIVIGIGMFVMTILSLARRKMTEHFCLVWGFLALVFVLAGVLLQPSGLKSYVSVQGIILIIVGLICVVANIWHITVQVSILSRKNQELAMQISLLNQENEKLVRELKTIEKERDKTSV